MDDEKAVRFVKMYKEESDKEANALIPREWKKKVRTERQEKESLVKRKMGNRKRKKEPTIEEEEEDEKHREKKERIIERMKRTIKDWKSYRV